MIAARINFRQKSRTQEIREDVTHWIRIKYVKVLLRALRKPLLSVSLVVAIFSVAVLVVITGHIRFNFFEGDPLRIFYVSVEMPPGSTLEETSARMQEIESLVRKHLRPEELRDTVSFAGQLWTETEPLIGDTMGQVMVSLNPARPGFRHVNAVGDAVFAAVKDIEGVDNISILRMEGGPPAGRDISIKIRGDDFGTLTRAADSLRSFLESHDVFSNISLDFRPGNPELVLRYDGEAIKRSGVNPNQISRILRAHIDGEIVTEFQDAGEEVTVRVLNRNNKWQSIDDLLHQSLSLPDGRSVALGEFIIPEYTMGQQNIKHYNFRRSITLEADIDEDRIDTVTANGMIEEQWQAVQTDYPSIDLEFAGLLDDIQESLDSMGVLFLFGIGLMYIITGTQFRSYWQPFMILVTVPLAFTGVVLGLLVTRNPISLFTMYGVIALAGISVNAAIVLISAANDRLARGMSLLHATIYAARRRVIPILITSLTTIAGLLSLATGLAGKSLVWGPVATAIVWGLTFSTILTLIVVPLLYRTFMVRSYRVVTSDTR